MWIRDVNIRVARCPVFNGTVRYFGPLSSIKIIVIPDNAGVNSSIFCQTDTGTASVWYFGETHLATLVNSSFWQTDVWFLKTSFKPVFSFTDLQASQIQRG